jgi:hypothetical protein
VRGTVDRYGAGRKPHHEAVDEEPEPGYQIPRVARKLSLCDGTRRPKQQEDLGGLEGPPGQHQRPADEHGDENHDAVHRDDVEVVRGSGDVRLADLSAEQGR